MRTNDELNAFREYLKDFAESRRLLADVELARGDKNAANYQRMAAVTVSHIAARFGDFLYAPTGADMSVVFSGMDEDIAIARNLVSQYVESAVNKMG